METLILFFFLLALIISLGLAQSTNSAELNALKKQVAELQRPKFVEIKKDPLAQLIDDTKDQLIEEYDKQLNNREKHIAQQAKEIEALEHTIALKDETIKHLNGDIAKLKFDYAAEVAGRNEIHEQGIVIERDTLDASAKCSEPDCTVCNSEQNASSPKAKKPIKRKALEVEVTCRTCDGSGTFLDDTVCPCCGGEGSVKIDA